MQKSKEQKIIAVYLQKLTWLKIPVSIISGDSTKETIDRAFTYPIVDMLGKPFSEANVKTILDKTLMYKELS